jgi:hypothetical protein
MWSSNSIENPYIRIGYDKTNMQLYRKPACGARGVAQRRKELSGGLGEWYLLRWRLAAVVSGINCEVRLLCCDGVAPNRQTGRPRIAAWRSPVD